MAPVRKAGAPARVSFVQIEPAPPKIAPIQGRKESMGPKSFEKKYGEGALLKAAYSSLNRLLVSKGIVTIAELKKGLAAELKVVAPLYEKERKEKRNK
jgi:hypothetical protein